MQEAISGFDLRRCLYTIVGDYSRLEVMNMRAAGAYLKKLREAQKGLTQSKLGELVGVSGNTIYRIEAGRQEPEGRQLAFLLTLLHGQIEHFQQLLTNTSATPEEAYVLADKALSIQILLRLANSDEKRRRLLLKVAQLTDDPVLAGRIEGYLDHMDEEQGDRQVP